jgi:ubiquinone/menaquinone biosynthesis C-methylase UbiE
LIADPAMRELESAAFALLGPRVTVFDLSEGQLERDRQAARHYGQAVRTIQGDMRDLSQLADISFDIVSQPYSSNSVIEEHERLMGHWLR